MNDYDGNFPPESNQFVGGETFVDKRPTFMMASRETGVCLLAQVVGNKPPRENVDMDHPKLKGCLIGLAKQGFAKCVFFFDSWLVFRFVERKC